MEKKSNLENKESTNLELVLEQFANELKSQTKSINELASEINSLHNLVIEDEMHNSKPTSVSTDSFVPAPYKLDSFLKIV